MKTPPLLHQTIYLFIVVLLPLLRILSLKTHMSLLVLLHMILPHLPLILNFENPLEIGLPLNTCRIFTVNKLHSLQIFNPRHRYHSLLQTVLFPCPITFHMIVFTQVSSFFFSTFYHIRANLLFCSS
jgi:hypothetical protein